MPFKFSRAYSTVYIRSDEVCTEILRRALAPACENSPAIKIADISSRRGFFIPT